MTAGPYRYGTLGVAVSGPDDVLREVESAFAGQGAAPKADVVFEVEERSYGGYVLRHPLLGYGAPVPEACLVVSHVVTMANRMVTSTDGVLLHAGAVAVEQGAVVVLAAGRAGKSTLVAALTLAGGGYLTDELTEVHPDGTVTGHRKPVSLRAGAWELDLGGDLPGCPPPGNWSRAVPPEALGRVGESLPQRPRLVVELVPDGEDAELDVPESIGVGLGHSVGFGADPGPQLAALASLARAPFVRLARRPPRALVELILGLDLPARQFGVEFQDEHGAIVTLEVDGRPLYYDRESRELWTEGP